MFWIILAVGGYIAYKAFATKIKGTILLICVALALILLIQTVGCKSGYERRQERKQQRQEKFDAWKEKRTPILPFRKKDKEPQQDSKPDRKRLLPFFDKKDKKFKIPFRR